MRPVVPDGLRRAGGAALLAVGVAAWAACGGEGSAGAPGQGPAARGVGSGGASVRLLQTPPSDSARADSSLAALRRAVALLERGHPNAAYDSLVSLSGRLSPAADWLRMARARAAADLGDTARVRHLLAGADSLPAPRWAWSIRVTALDSAGDPAGAARRALAGAGEGLPPEARAAALLRAGRLWAEADSVDRSHSALLRAAAAGPDREPALEAAEELLARGDLSADGELAVARTLAAHGLWWRAHPRYRRYLDATAAATPSRADRDEVRVAYGRSLLHAGRYPAAIRVLGELAAGRDTALVAEAALLEARARLRYRADDDGVERLVEVARRFPDRPEAGEALELLAERAEQEGRTAEARRYWVRAARHAASAREAELRLVRSGALAYLDGAYDSAAALFAERGGKALGEEARQRSLFWAGLSHRAAGRAQRGRALLEAALTMNRLDYYGSRAAEILGRPLLPADLLPGPRTPGIPERELSNAVLRLRVAEALPYPAAVSREAERLEAHFARYRNGRYALAESMIGSGFPLPGVRVAAGIRTRQEGLNLRLLRLLYPFPHREEIRRVAAARGLSPYLLAGLIRQESLFEAEIESYAGAIGLMQIMPGTGRELAREHGVPGFRTSDLRQPALNLRLGTEYLRELLDRFGDGLSYALAAYNAGPHRVARWRRRPFGADPDLFVEGIPFRQTRHYVKAVQAHARVYAALYGCGSSGPCLGREASFAIRDDGDAGLEGDARAR